MPEPRLPGISVTVVSSVTQALAEKMSVLDAGALAAAGAKHV